MKTKKKYKAELFSTTKTISKQCQSQNVKIRKKNQITSNIITRSKSAHSNAYKNESETKTQKYTLAMPKKSKQKNSIPKKNATLPKRKKIPKIKAKIKEEIDQSSPKPQKKENESHFSMESAKKSNLYPNTNENSKSAFKKVFIIFKKIILIIEL